MSLWVETYTHKKKSWNENWTQVGKGTSPQRNISGNIFLGWILLLSLIHAQTMYKQMICAKIKTHASIFILLDYFVSSCCCTCICCCDSELSDIFLNWSEKIGNKSFCPHIQRERERERERGLISRFPIDFHILFIIIKGKSAPSPWSTILWLVMLFNNNFV